ncbi:MAG: hypothetical protein H0W83_12835 [Planctomycetes bacterium]|nr:hypothetical protein [Planctomycetota bacterium]
MILRALAVSCIAVLACGLSGCGETRTLSLTYVKKDSSESKMLQDADDLKRTGGVKQVLPQIDSANTITLVLNVDEDDSAKGRQKALDLGYAQVRN